MVSTKEELREGEQLLAGRQKLIKLADRSGCGWATVSACDWRFSGYPGRWAAYFEVRKIRQEDFVGKERKFLEQSLSQIVVFYGAVHFFLERFL